MTGIRRSLPYLAAGSVLVAVAITATFAAGTAASPKSAALDAAVTRALSVQVISVRAISVRAVAADARSAVSLASAATEARAASMRPASAKAAVAASAAAEIATTRSLVTTKNAALRARGVPCDSSAAACVSLSKQEAWLLRGGRVVYGPVRVATGRAGLPTPTGNFHVWYKVVNGWSSIYDSPMPYSVFFYGGDAFHEDPVTVRSHGCVHLSLANAEHFYRFLQYGNLVEVRR
jgi:lipoprotein-anchoring transpeptidase ErfK/SrfK